MSISMSSRRRRFARAALVSFHSPYPEALDALAADEVVQNGIGADLAREFIRLKRME